MKKQFAIGIVLLLCGAAFGQTGALMGWQGGALSDVALAGPGGIIGHDISLLMGGLAPALGTCAPQGYGYNFFTGPDLIQGSHQTYIDGASFGREGVSTPITNRRPGAREPACFRRRGSPPS